MGFRIPCVPVDVERSIDRPITPPHKKELQAMAWLIGCLRRIESRSKQASQSSVSPVVRLPSLWTGPVRLEALLTPQSVCKRKPMDV